MGIQRLESSATIEWLDLAKGIGIILVVLGHCMFPCHQLIDVFHMPLFFFISGITFRHKQLETFLISKIDRIGIPYVFWSIISAILAFIPHPWSGPFNGPLWFLQCLFCALIITELMGGLYKTYRYLGTGLIFLFLYISSEIQFLDELPFNLDRALMAYIYIFMGIELKNLLITKSIFINRFLDATLCTIAFLCLFIFLHIQGKTSGMFFNLTLYDEKFLSMFSLSLLGILSTVLISKYIIHFTFIKYCGKNSLLIMCVHFPLAQLLNVNISHLHIYQSGYGKVVCALSEYLIVGLFCYIMIRIVKKYLPKLGGYKPFLKLK